jgi:hypothetical protein
MIAERDLLALNLKKATYMANPIAKKKKKVNKYSHFLETKPTQNDQNLQEKVDAPIQQPSSNECSSCAIYFDDFNSKVQN